MYFDVYIYISISLNTVLYLSLLYAVCFEHDRPALELPKKALLIVVPVFLKVKIRTALRRSIVNLEDLLKLNNICHLIRKFSNLSLFFLSGEFF